MADYNLQYQDTYIDALLATANELKSNGYIFKGVATPTTNPGTTTEKIAYIASESGTYTNFGNLAVTGLSVLTFNGTAWSATSLNINLDIVQTTGQSTTSVMSQKAVTDEIDNIIQGENAINVSSLPVGNGYPNSRGRCWVVDSVTREHYILEKYPEYKKLKFTANSSWAASIVFLKSYTTPTNNAPLPLCDTPYSIRAAQAGVTQVVDIPEDCKYIIIGKRIASSNIYTPAFLSLMKSDEENEGWNGEFDARYNSLPVALGWVGVNGAVVSGDGKENYMFDVVGVDKIEITAGTNNTYYTWASATATTGWTPLAAARYEVAANTKTALSIPTGAKYLVIGKATGGSDYTPASTIFYTNKYNLYNSAVDIASQEELLGWLGGNGQWYFSGLSGSAHLAIPVVGESVTIVPNANHSYYTWASAVEGYNWTLVDAATRVEISNTTTLSIPQNAKYIIFGVRSSYQAGNYFTPQSVIFHQSLISCVSRLNDMSMKTKTWRFMTYNIGHLNGGGVTDIDKRRKSSIADSDYDNKKYIGVSICNNFNNDFIGVTEYPLDFAPFTTSHSTETTREILFKKYWSNFIDLNGQDPAHIGDVNYDDYNAMFGRIPLLDMHKVEWNSELLANRFYMVGTGLLGECEVKIVLAHFGFNNADKTDTTKQDIQVAELVAAFQQEQYVIIMGDLNIPSLSVLDPFISAGYSLANGGAFGTFNTYRYNDGFATRALDNIIVKGFNIKNVYMVDTDYSDHNPLLADLELNM